MPLNLIHDHVSTLAKKLPTLYRRRTFVLLGLLALHLFIVTPFVRLSTEEQSHQHEADRLQILIDHVQSVEDDIHKALDQVDRQKADLLNDLVTSFKELTEARADLGPRSEDRFMGSQFPPTGQFQGFPGQRTEPASRFAEAVATAESAADPVAAYRELIRNMILDPAFSEANRRWQDEKLSISADLAKIRKGLAADDNFNEVKNLLADIDQEIRTHRFTAPKGDWWMTVEEKEKVLDKNLARITSKLNNAITPLAESSERLTEKIEEKKATLAKTRIKKQELADRAAENLERVEKSLHVTVIDGVQAMTFFPMMLAVALGLMTIDICRCLQALNRCRSVAGAAVQAEISQWLTVVARPSYGLHGITAVWILIAAFHVRPLNTDIEILVGQTAVAIFVLVTVAVWEGITRRKNTSSMRAEAQADNGGKKNEGRVPGIDKQG